MVRNAYDRLEQFIGDYGWGFKKKQCNVWVTGWEGHSRFFPLRIEHGETWVTFEVRPFLGLGIDWENWPEISVFLLQLNGSCRMIRVGITEDGELGLVLDIFAKGLSFEQFSEALGVLGYYADYAHEEIINQLDRIGFEEIEIPQSPPTQ